jgi:ornithine decarboxylase
MTDPNKLTVLTPGFDATAAMPSTACRRRWWRNTCAQNRIVPEKNDLNSLLFLLTPGVESSKAGTLLSHLVTFKKLHDRNAPLEEVIPELRRAPPERYAGVRLRDLCAEMHERLTERSKPMIDYLRMFETCFNTFPGFDVEIQGIYRKVDANGRIRLYTYVVSE